jgi:hypothetical protein
MTSARYECSELMQEFVDLRERPRRDEIPVSYDMWSSRVKSTMEMSLRHFIDPAHQGSHAHGCFRGQGKL